MANEQQQPDTSDDAFLEAIKTNAGEQVPVKPSNDGAPKEQPPKENDEGGKEQPTGKPVETQIEPSIEIEEGVKLTASEIKKLREEAKQNADWKTKNRLESEELNRIRAEEAEKLRIANEVMQRPDVLQRLREKPQERDFDDELEQLYQQQPDPIVNPHEYNQWLQIKDQVVYQKAFAEAAKLTQQNLAAKEIQAHNEKFIQKLSDDYIKTGKLTETEMLAVGKWMKDNLYVPDGKWKPEHFEVGYQTVFRNKWLEEAKLEATKKVEDAIKNAKPADTSNGQKPPETKKTQKDNDDDEFIRRLAKT